jgi:hypothetical protein
VVENRNSSDASEQQASSSVAPPESDPFKNGGVFKGTERATIKANIKRRSPYGKLYTVDAMFPRVLEGAMDLNSVDEGTAALLKGFVMALRPNIILETGTHKGRSTRAMAEGLAFNGEGMLYTVDKDDYGLLESGAIRDHERPYVTQIIAPTPDAYTGEPLISLMGIDFAFIDGDHTREGLMEDLVYVDAHRAEECFVVVDNAKDVGWPDIEAYFSEYHTYVHFLLPTCTGLQIIHMK